MKKYNRNRIAIAIRQLSKSSGAVKNVQEQVDFFTSKGIGVDIYAERIRKDSLLNPGVKIYKIIRLPLPKYYKRKAFEWQVKVRQKRRKPNLLISHGDIDTNDVLSIHNCVHLAHEIIYDEPLPKSNPVGRIHDWILNQKRFRLLITNSQLAAKDLSQRYELNPSTVKVIYPGYDPEQFNITTNILAKKNGREYIGYWQKKPLIGLITSGNFKKRNIEGFIKAIPLVDKKLNFIIVGKDRFVNEYRLLADKLGVSQRIIWKHISQKVHLYYHAVDLFVLPAHIEEFGRTALEAMACGKPVLLGPKVGCAELLGKTTKICQLSGVSKDNIAEGINRIMSLSSQEKTDIGMKLNTIARNYTGHKQTSKLFWLLKDRFQEIFEQGFVKNY